ncbi:MAG: STAS domain-containing protein [bacterium]
MATRFRDGERIAVIEGYGSLTMTEIDNFRDEVVGALIKRCKILLVNFSDTEFADSIGIGTVVVARDLARTRESKFGVFGVRGIVKDVFDRMRLGQALNIFENEEEAIEKLGGGVDAPRE